MLCGGIVGMERYTREENMRILIAPDSFKGSLSAVAASDAIRRGAMNVFPGAEYDSIPIADGGEGTVESLTAATGGTLFSSMVHDPLGNPVRAVWGILGDGVTAVVEMAAASGLPLLRPDELDPLHASSYGTGELMAAAMEKLHSRPGGGTPRLLLGIGGSATNDGGAGALQALGLGLCDAAGEVLPPGGEALAYLESIDARDMHPLLAATEIFIASDVDNPLCGPHGAAAVFGPQKGATPEQIAQLDAALDHFARKAAQATGRDVAGLPGAGAAGGLGAGLLFFTGARLRSGIDCVLDSTDFDARVRKADLVFTGEGNTDFQTARGKAPVGVARRAKQFGKPVVCLSGGLGEGYEAIYAQGVDAAMSAVPKAATLEECMANAEAYLERAAERACRLIRVGMPLSGGTV